MITKLRYQKGPLAAMNLVSPETRFKLNVIAQLLLANKFTISTSDEDVPSQVPIHHSPEETTFSLLLYLI